MKTAFRTRRAQPNRQRAAAHPDHDRRCAGHPGRCLARPASTARLTYRANQYQCSVAAAEAATEKVLSQISPGFSAGR